MRGKKSKKLNPRKSRYILWGVGGGAGAGSALGFVGTVSGGLVGGA